MSRPRAGHSWTWDDRGHSIFQRSNGEWVPTEFAQGWPRCSRCRGPSEDMGAGVGPKLCVTCYFYHCLSVAEFWRLHEAGYRLAPYNIGRRCMAAPPPRRIRKEARARRLTKEAK